MEQIIEENVVEPSPNYRLDQHDQDNIKIEEEIIIDNKLNKGIHSLKFNYNDQYVAAGYRDGKVRIFNVKTGKMKCDLDCNKPGTETLVQSIKWRPKIEGRTNNILMTVCKDTVTEWHTQSRIPVHQHTPQADQTIYSLEYSNDGLHYALGLKDCSIRVYDGVTRKEEIKLGGIDNHKVTGHQNKIYALKYSKENPKVLISGGWDDTVLFWDLNSGTHTRVLVGPHIFGEGLDINCFGELLTASWRSDKALQLWDTELGEEKQNINWTFGGGDDLKNTTQLYCCKFSNDFGKLIFAGGSQSNAVKIFDYTGRPVATIDKLSHACVALDSSNDLTKGYQLFAQGGGEGIIRIFKITYINANF